VPEQLTQSIPEDVARGKELPTCLILAPQEARFDRVRRTIADCLVTMSVQPVSLDTQVQRGVIISNILRAIETADALIVDITSANPNVMYELGFAHALRKPALFLVRRDEARIPADLVGYLYYVYDDEDEAGLSKDAPPLGGADVPELRQ